VLQTACPVLIGPFFPFHFCFSLRFGVCECEGGIHFFFFKIGRGEVRYDFVFCSAFLFSSFCLSLPYLTIKLFVTMIPSNFQDSYHQYKSDTNTIAQWLATTARRCGFRGDILAAEKPANETPTKPEPTIHVARLKGRARKLAREAEEKRRNNSTASSGITNKKPHLITLKSFVPLAKHIASHDKPPVKVSLSFLTLVRRAITLRERHSTWHKSIPQQHELNDDGHDHFIAILLEVHDILQVRCVDTTTSKVKTSDNIKPNEDRHERNKNVFDVLEVEEPSEGFIQYQPLPTANKQKKANTEDDSEMNYAVIDEKDKKVRFLAVSCFFSDMMDFRTIIGNMWGQYRLGRSRLEACAAATEVAIKWVQSAQEKFEEEWGPDTDWNEIIQSVYEQICTALGVDSDKKDAPLPFNLVVSEQAEWLMMGTSSIIQQYLGRSAKNKIPVFKSPVGEDKQEQDKDQQVAYTQLHPKKKFAISRSILYNCLEDILWVIREEDVKFAETSLIKYARHVRDGGKAQLWGIFAAQLMIDTHADWKEEDVARGYMELHKSCEAMCASLDQAAYIPNDQASLRLAKTVHSFLADIVMYVETDMVATSKNKIGFKETDDTTNTDNRLLKQNIHWAGLLLLHFKLDFQHRGIAWVNESHSLFEMAHLYNAMQATGYLEGQRWPDMDLMIASQGTSHIFVGSRATDIETCFTRYLIASGISSAAAANVATLRDSKRENLRVVRPPRKLKHDVAPVSHLFRTELIPCTCEKHESLILQKLQVQLAQGLKEPPSLVGHSQFFEKVKQTNADVADILMLRKPSAAKMECVYAVSSVFSKTPDPDKMKKNETPRETIKHLFALPGPAQFIVTVHDALIDEFELLNLNYFDLHFHSWAIFKNIATELKDDVQDYCTTDWTTNDFRPVFVVNDLLHLLSGALVCRCCISEKLDQVSKAVAVEFKTFITEGAAAMQALYIGSNKGVLRRFDDVLDEGMRYVLANRGLLLESILSSRSKFTD